LPANLWVISEAAQGFSRPPVADIGQHGDDVSAQIEVAAFDRPNPAEIGVNRRTSASFGH
jgi:hypothetical protein